MPRGNRRIPPPLNAARVRPPPGECPARPYAEWSLANCFREGAGVLRPTYGQGPSVEVRAKRSAGNYRRDLDLELEGTAEVCAALGRSEVVDGFKDQPDSKEMLKW